MKYDVYGVDGSTVILSEAEAPEISCDSCGATWLHDTLVGALVGCPYCGDDDWSFFSSLSEQSGREASYVRDLRGIVRALWSGVLDLDQAFALFDDTVRIGLNRAAQEGAGECGILPADMSPEERNVVLQAIAHESARIFPFLSDVLARNKASGTAFAVHRARVEMWGLRYGDVLNRIKLMACADQKLRWTLNYLRNVVESCPSCVKLNGKVKRASYWMQNQVQPQNPPNPKLICGGWKCGCGLPVTDEPISKGPLPRLP